MKKIVKDIKLGFGIQDTTKIRANTFGFYSINGQSVVDFKQDSKKESVCEFFELVREQNMGKDIILILDNFRSHWAKKTRMKAEELEITLVFLPPYSPDLNPIEKKCSQLKSWFRKLTHLHDDKVDLIATLLREYCMQAQLVLLQHYYLKL